MLALKEADVMKMLAASTHLGTQNADYQMLQYAYKRKKDGTWRAGGEAAACLNG